MDFRYFKLICSYVAIMITLWVVKHFQNFCPSEHFLSAFIDNKLNAILTINILEICLKLSYRLQKVIVQ